MTWINIHFDPIIGAAFKEMFDREVRRQSHQPCSWGTGGHRVNLTMDLSILGDPKASAYTQDGQPAQASILNRLLCSAEILLWVTDIDNLALVCPTHLRAGNQPHQWVLQQDLTGHLIDKWANPSPRPPPKPNSRQRGTAGTHETEHDPPPLHGQTTNRVRHPNPNGSEQSVESLTPDQFEPVALPPRW